jgi:hypothetical protein
MKFSKLFSFIAVALLVAVVFAGLVSVPVAAQTPTVGAGTWNIETVDSSGGQYTSLQLTPAGWPAISYARGSNLMYAYKDESGWHTETADRPGGLGYYTSLQLTSTGWPAISYAGGSTLKYAYKDASGWHNETADSGGLYGTGDYSSLALNSTDWPAISWCDYSNNIGVLKYAYKDALGWHTETVDSDAVDSIGQYNSLQLTSTGWPVISYNGVGYLKYAYKDASGWHNETVDRASGSTSLQLTSTGWPAISYSGDHKYAYKDEGGWHLEKAPSSGSLQLTSTDQPAISYSSLRVLNYSYKDESGWHNETVDRGSSGVYGVGYDISLALTSTDWPAISYIDKDNTDLKYAYWTPSATLLTITAPSAAFVNQNFTVKPRRSERHPPAINEQRHVEQNSD